MVLVRQPVPFVVQVMFGNYNAAEQALSVVNVAGNNSQVNGMHPGVVAAAFQPQVTVVPVKIVLLHSKADLSSEHYYGFVKH